MKLIDKINSSWEYRIKALVVILFVLEVVLYFFGFTLSLLFEGRQALMATFILLPINWLWGGYVGRKMDEIGF